VLRDDGRRAPLLAAVADVDRLVLLGDVVELRHAPVREALNAAEPVLRELGAVLGSDSEVVIVPGNHDHHLLAGWIDRRARAAPPPPLALESPVDWRDEEPLAKLASWLAPASVRVAYPGAWLRADIYAMHGHYGDRHTTVPMFERLGAGAMARVLREPVAGPRSAEDYEAILAPIYSWIHAIAQNERSELGNRRHGGSARAWMALSGEDGGSALRRRAMLAAFRALVGALNLARLGPLRADLSGVELRRAGLRAFGQALGQLDVSAAHVIFGHTHRAGPLAGDDRSEWIAANGTTMLNTGCWIHEPGFLGRVPGRSPYRPGFVATIGDEGPPELSNVLDPV
jgi:hypothetical protein